MKTKSLIKIGISLAMLVIVGALVDVDALTTLLASVPMWVVAVVLIGYFAGQLLSVVKWWMIAREAGVEVSMAHTVKAYLIGSFVNIFGLGLVGGDVARGLLLAQGKPVKAASMASVIADRVHGLGVLLVIGVVASFVLEGHAIPLELRYLLAGIALMLGTIWYFGSSIAPRILPKSSPISDSLLRATRAFPRKPLPLFTITAISIIFHLSQIALHWCIARGLAIDISWSTLLVGVPFVNILSSLPLSWNGLGVRENAYVFFLAPLVTYEQAVVFGALWFGAVAATSAVGGILSFATGDFARLQASRTSESPEAQPVVSST